MPLSDNLGGAELPPACLGQVIVGTVVAAAEGECTRCSQRSSVLLAAKCGCVLVVACCFCVRVWGPPRVCELLPLSL